MINCNVGEVVNGLEILESFKQGDKKKKCLFLCQCGGTFVSSIYSVRSGNTKSCGCYHKKIVSEIGLRNKKHGDASARGVTKLYKTWSDIKSRCYNRSDYHYKWYGERGILMDNDWKNSYSIFKNWILETLGERPKEMSLDRIDNDIGYFKGNLRWATQKEQVRNSRLTKISDCDAKRIRKLYSSGQYTQKDIGDIFNVSRHTIMNIVNHKRNYEKNNS